MSKAGKTSSIKYEDKSEGQPELVPVFNDLKKVLSGYVSGNFSVKDDLPGNYSVYYNKPVEVSGRKYPELPLAGLLIQKGYVGFYLFSVYTEPELVKKLPPDLRKMLKGKSCFHLKTSPPALMKEVDQALQTGVEYYRSRGWM